MPKFWSTIAAASVASLFAISQAAAAPCTEANSIAKIRNRAPAGPYEYVIFDFVKPPNLPNFTVTTVHPPFTEDPSGNPVTIAGKKFKRVQFQGVVWTCSIKESFNLPRTAIKGIKSTEQFEGYISYVIGIRKASKFDGSYSYSAGSVTKIVVRVRK
jgi:hypothetical protein